MSCVRNETRLRKHAHGAPLSPELEAHIASCAVCQEAMAAEQRLLSEIDRALDGVGGVEPSPVFLARARAVALDRPRRLRLSERFAVLRRWPVWALPTFAGALLIAALVARTRPPVEPTPGSPSASSTPAFAARHSPAPGASPSSSPPPRSSVPRLPPPSHEMAAAARRSLARPPSSGPPAIVAPGQAEAIVRLATLIDAGALAPPALLLEPPDPAQELRPPTEVNLRSLIIEPIVREGTDKEGDTL